MIGTETFSTSFEGNDSTETGYAVTWPFLNNLSYIKVAVLEDGEEDEVELTGGQFEAYRDGGNVYVRTTVAYDDTFTVRVYRELPILQPLSLPVSGALSPTSVEAAFDRVTMLLQQINGGGGSGSGSLPETFQDTLSFADATARLATVPQRAWQLGVQQDDQTIWISLSATVGDWQQFNSTETVAQANRLIIAATADAGAPGTTQDDILFRCYDWAVDAVICAGDNHYTPATFAEAWAAFGLFIFDEKVYPALGNHDEDDWDDHSDLFPYLPALPADRRYYKVSLGGGLLDLFVLHSGRDSSWNAIEPDGNYEGSAQHAWFVAQLAASSAVWKVAVMHHPPVTSSEEANRADVNLDWPEFAQLDGIICGHVHFSEWLTCRGTPIINVSGCVQMDGDSSDTLNLVGVDAIGSNLLWHNDRLRLLAKLTITPTRFLVAYHEVSSGRLVYQRDLGDRTQHRHEWGQEVVGPDDLVPLGLVTVGICPCSLARGTWVISVGITGSATLEGTVTVDGSIAGSWSIAAGDMWTEVESLRNVRRGALVKVNVTGNPAYGAWYGLSCHYRGQLVG